MDIEKKKVEKKKISITSKERMVPSDFTEIKLKYNGNSKPRQGKTYTAHVNPEILALYKKKGLVK